MVKTSAALPDVTDELVANEADVAMIVSIEKINFLMNSCLRVRDLFVFVDVLYCRYLWFINRNVKVCI